MANPQYITLPGLSPFPLFSNQELHFDEWNSPHSTRMTVSANLWFGAPVFPFAYPYGRGEPLHHIVKPPTAPPPPPPNANNNFAVRPGPPTYAHPGQPPSARPRLPQPSGAPPGHEQTPRANSGPFPQRPPEHGFGAGQSLRAGAFSGARQSWHVGSGLEQPSLDVTGSGQSSRAGLDQEQASPVLSSLKVRGDSEGRHGDSDPYSNTKGSVVGSPGKQPGLATLAANKVSTSPESNGDAQISKGDGLPSFMILPIDRPKELEGATPVLPASLIRHGAPTWLTSRYSASTKPKVGVQLTDAAGMFQITATNMNAKSLSHRAPEREKSYKNWQGDFEIDAVWKRYYELNSEVLREEPTLTRALYWEQQAKLGRTPPDDIANWRRKTAEELKGDIFKEPEVEAQESYGPWTEGTDVVPEWDGSSSQHGAGQAADDGSSNDLPESAPKRRRTTSKDYVDVKSDNDAAPAPAILIARKTPVVVKQENTWKPKGKGAPANGANRPPLGMIRVLGESSIPAKMLGSARHYLRSWAPPCSTDVTLMGPVEITAVELLTFFPNHFNWDAWTRRLHSSGWGASPAMAMIAITRGVEFWDVNTYNRMAKRFPKREQPTKTEEDVGQGKAKKQTNRNAARGDAHSVTDFTCRNWKQPKLSGWDNKLIDYYVVDLSIGVRRNLFPKGRDRGPLTCAIEYVLDHPRYQWVKLTDLDWLCLTKGFIRPWEQNDQADKNPDKAALERHEKDIKEFKKNIKKRSPIDS